MDHIPRLSEAVYVGLCHKIGSPTEVRIRREVIDTVDVVSKPAYILKGFDRMRSGSRREGFRMRTCDYDYMLWLPDHKVICDLSQISLYRIPRHTVILMECEELPAGFARLNLMTSSNETKIRSSCVVINKDLYISSSLFRESYLKFLQANVVTSSSFRHGPCSTMVYKQCIENDYAFCLQSHHWPAIAIPWIRRCHQQGWPSENVISDIVSAGFHVVPICSEHGNGQEWRISFSLAEQKLVYAMNHCQFLCYGLFKIFLKEVINFQNPSPVLCSYFTKTILFWVIQTNNSLTWTPENFLPCFWECFKLLIYWVFIGECPNFFIPENNMFRFKVNGSAQTLLFNQFYDLYCKGTSCLLLSKTLRPFLSQVILNRELKVCTNESSIITNTEIDMCLIGEFYGLDGQISSVKEFAAYMKKIEKMIDRRLTQYQEVTIQHITSAVLRNTAMLIQSSKYPSDKRNKIYYETSNVYGLLKLSCSLCYLKSILLFAMYLYRTHRYERSLSCLQKVQERISLPYITYYDHVNVEMYRSCLGGMSLGNKISRTLLKNIELCCDYKYIDELVLEQTVAKENGFLSICIPPIVLLHMLLILNHHRLGDTSRSQQSLQDLKTLLSHDVGITVHTHLREISWQILGICQQICGNYLAALESYQRSFQHEPFNKIQEATVFRISTLPFP